MSAPTSVTLTASYSGVSKATSLTVNPTSASFLGMDTTTQGNWRSTYNDTSVTIIGDSALKASYVTITPSLQGSYVWASSTTDIRALSKLSLPTSRIAAFWYSSNYFYVDISLSDQSVHQLAIYSLDWNYLGRTERIDVLDASTNAVLDTRTISNFTNGVYALWNVTGHVRLRITRTGGKNAVISGIFLK